MIVADTNLIAYWLINGPFSSGAQAAFERDDVWIAPPVWRYEMLNVLATTVRADLISLSTATAIYNQAAGFMIEKSVGFREALELSAAEKFATYDCFFVVLARQEKYPWLPRIKG